MPYATNPDDGVRIYYEVTGSGPPILMLHGLTQTITIWKRNGYFDALQNRYQLISIDARGHGKSDKPHDSTLHGGDQAMATDSIAVLNTLDINHTHVIGYSMGAMTGYRLTAEFPDRICSAILGGGPTNLSAERRSSLIGVFQQGPEALIQGYEQSVGELTSERHEEVLQLDMAAMSSAAAANVTEPITDKAFSKIPVPYFLFVGDQDVLAFEQVQHIATLIPDVELHILPELDHNQLIMESDYILPQIITFLNRIENERLVG